MNITLQELKKRASVVWQAGDDFTAIRNIIDIAYNQGFNDGLGDYPKHYERGYIDGLKEGSRLNTR